MRESWTSDSTFDSLILADGANTLSPLLNFQVARSLSEVTGGCLLSCLRSCQREQLITLGWPQWEHNSIALVLRYQLAELYWY